MLSIAFKLEDLKVQFDRLAKKTNDIADYYRSTGSTDEKRFRRVSDMFSAAKDKVEEIKSKIRDRAGSMGADDALEIRQDINYLKDVMMKDILFVMLSSGDDIEQIKSGAIKQCGTDSACFDRGFRVCQPLTFASGSAISVEVKGLEGDTCVLHASMPAESGQTYEMTCNIQKYSLGISDPDNDIFPYCSGNLVEIIKKLGTGQKAPPSQASSG